MNRKTLVVFTNARNIRNFEHSFDDGFLPKLITFSEFINRCFFVDGCAQCDNIMQILSMQEAVIKTKKATSILNFPSEFFEFMKNSEYLFSFFKELAVEKKSIQNLKNSDVYADYDEHLTILEELFLSYCQILKQNQLYDDITACFDYQINEAYIRNYNEIIVQIDGFISEFEFEILRQIRSFCKIILRFSVSDLNKKIIDKISSFTKLDFETEHIYEIDFSLDKILKKTQQDSIPKLLIKGFYLRSMQCAYVFEKISTFIDQGIDPQKIAIILPDEEFASILKLHDRNNMLNFAMGDSFTNTLFYEILLNITLALKDEEDIFFSEDYLTQSSFFEKYELFFSSCGVTKELFDKFKTNFKKDINHIEFCKLCDEILLLGDDEKVRKLLEKPLFDIRILLDKFSFSLEKLCDIFLNIISQIRIDHVGGGSVSVIGLLESRSMQYDGVVIVDFNDDLVPKRSVNEMFLNSKIREKAGLISYQDRENLQKFYYESVIRKSQKCAICYCIGEDKLPSRFLSYFNCAGDDFYSEDDYLCVFKKEINTKLRSDDEKIVLRHNFFENKLSFSRLNTFMTCKRKYFYSYIQNIKEPKNFGIQKNYALKGTISHQSLSLMYKKSDKFDLKILSEIYTRLAIENGLNALEIRYQILNFKRLEELIKNHENNGWTVLETESEDSSKDADFCGVEIYGKIDRIDIKDGVKMIIDYKSGHADGSSLQLPFYEALLGKECESRFLSLKDMKFVESKKTILDLENEIENLKTIFSDEVSFERPISVTPCRFCAYRLMCKREI